MMILCVWAMYNRSRLIICVTLTLYSLEIIASVTSAATASNLKNISGMYTITEELACCANKLPIMISFCRSLLSACHPNTGRIVLFGDVRTGLEERSSLFAGHTCCSIVRPRDDPVSEAVARNVPRHNGVASQSIHELTRQAEHALFLRVRFVLLHRLLTELTIAPISASFCPTSWPC